VFTKTPSRLETSDGERSNLSAFRACVHFAMSARTRASALEALGYAKGAPPLDLNDKAFRELVVWLEDTKIRATPMDARGPLRAIDSGEWPSAFAALARETSCPADATNPKETARAFDHLLSSAVALDYRDDADALGAVVKTLKLGVGTSGPPDAKRQRVAAASRDGAPRPQMANLSDPALRSKLVELARALDVDAEAAMREGGGDSGGGVEALTRACARAVERFVAPFWDAVERAEKGTTSAAKKASWNLSALRDFPPGMDLGGPSGSDETVRAAVAVMRVLHVNDMRALQTAVDALLVQMQEYTGDPKTDAGAGKVGRG
jgi:RLL motif-containing protein 1